MLFWLSEFLFRTNLKNMLRLQTITTGGLIFKLYAGEKAKNLQMIMLIIKSYPVSMRPGSQNYVGQQLRNTRL